MVNVHPVEQKSVRDQIDVESSSHPNAYKPSGTANGLEAIDDQTSYDDHKSNKDSLITLDDGDGVGLDKKAADSTLKQSDSSLKETPYGKPCNFNGHVIAPRLTPAMIRALLSPSDQLPKLPFKTYRDPRSKVNRR